MSRMTHARPIDAKKPSTRRLFEKIAHVRAVQTAVAIRNELDQDREPMNALTKYRCSA